MNIYRNFFAVVIVGMIGIIGAMAQAPNELTENEKQNGWKLLFDGKTFDGWQRLANSGWSIKDGQLLAQASDDGKQKDIITTDQFENFELSVDFSLSKLTNSGIKYLVTNTYPGQEGSFLGLEYQILDDVNYKYPERGIYRSLASLYDLIPANKKDTISLYKWNVAWIIVKGNYIEQWLNGKMVVKYDRSTEDFKVLVENSKYKNLEKFGKTVKGHILLQNEGTPISFRNIKIKPLL